MSSYYEKILATGEVKCIDEEIPFEIPQGWEWCRVTDVMLKITDGTHRSPTNTDNGDFMYITAKNIKEDGISLANITFVSKDVHDEIYSRCNPEYGDLLYIKDGATTGIVTINNIKKPFSLLSSVALLKPTSEINTNYILFFLRTPLNLESVRSSMKGCAITRITLRQIEKWLVPVPPYEEQLRIVSFIKELLPYLDIYSSLQMNLNLLNININNKLKKSILQEAIQGKLVPQIAEEGTAQELLEQIKAEKQKLVKEGKLKKSALNDSIIFRGDDNRYYEKIGKKCVDITEEIPFEIPNSWTWARMGGIGDWGAGSTPQRTNQNYYGGNILWLKTGELNNGIVYDTEEKITQKAFQDCSLRMNKIGDVLIAMYGATIGKLAVVGKELTTNQACCGCTPYIVFNWYLFYFLMASRDTFIKKGEGGAQPNISRVKLVEHLIPLPPLREQKRIVQKIEQLMQLLK